MQFSTYKFVLIISCILFSTSLIFAQDDMSDVKAKIKKMNTEVEKAVLGNNGEALLKYYADDAISMPSYQPMIKGIAALKASAMKDKESGMKMTKFNLTTTDVFGNGNLVVEIGKYDLTLEMPQMPDPMDDHGKYLTVYEKQSDGSLKVKAETWNTDLNPWMEMGKHEMEDHDMDKDDMDNDSDKN